MRKNARLFTAALAAALAMGTVSAPAMAASVTSEDGITAIAATEASEPEAEETGAAEAGAQEIDASESEAAETTAEETDLAETNTEEADAADTDTEEADAAEADTAEAEESSVREQEEEDADAAAEAAEDPSGETESAIDEAPVSEEASVDGSDGSTVSPALTEEAAKTVEAETLKKDSAYKTDLIIDGNYVRNTIITHNDGPYYVEANGNEIKLTLVTIDGKDYISYVNGYVKNMWVPTGSGLCYFGEDGSKQTGLVYYHGYRYPVGDDGVLKINSWITLNGKTYYTDSQGRSVTGWHQVNYRGTMCYFNSDGNLRRLCFSDKLSQKSDIFIGRQGKNFFLCQ